MSGLGPNFPFEQEDEYNFMLRREPSSESLKLIFQVSQQRIAHNRRYSRQAAQFSKKILLGQSKTAKMQRKETKKIFGERNFWIRNQKRMERAKKSALSPTGTTSDTRAILDLESNTKRSMRPVKLFYQRKREMIGEQLHSINDGLRGHHGDLPSPKSDSWFGEEGTDFMDEARSNLAQSSRMQNTFSFVERGVDLIGGRISRLKKKSLSSSSLASPSVSMFLAPSRNLCGQNYGSFTDRTLSPLESSSPGLSSSDSNSSMPTPATSPSFCQLSPTAPTALAISSSSGESQGTYSLGLLNRGKGIDVPEVIPENEEGMQPPKPQLTCNTRFLAENCSSISSESGSSSEVEPSGSPTNFSDHSSLGCSTHSTSISNLTAAPNNKNFRIRNNSRQVGSSKVRRHGSLLHSSPLVASSSKHHKESLATSLYGIRSLESSPSVFGNRRCHETVTKLLNIGDLVADQHTIVIEPETNTHPRNPEILSPQVEPRSGIWSRNFDQIGSSLPRRVSKHRSSGSPRPRSSTEAGPSSSVRSSPQRPQYATEVLIQQQGGFSFFGKEKFNERFRSQPWQTIKTIRKYDRPGKWDAQYVDGPGTKKIVQTPYDTKSFLLPTENWSWVDDFTIDRHSRPVDNQGWEYYDIFSRQWQPRRHGLRTFARRRKWLRTRVKRVPSMKRTYDYKSGSFLEVKGSSSLSDSEEPEESKFVIVELKKVGCKQILKFRNLSSLISNPMAFSSGIPWFRLYCDNQNPECHNPFFSGKKIVSALLEQLRQPSNGVQSSNPETKLKTEELESEIRDECLKYLTQINLKRALKVLCELSEHQKIKLWRYWLGLDTYEDDVYRPSRPNLEDVWAIITENLDKILDIFIFQRTKFMFLYLISRMHPHSKKLNRRSNSTQSQSIPSCFSPMLCQASPSQIDTTLAHQELTNSSSSPIDLLPSCKSKLSFWDDAVRLLADFNWGVNEAVDLGKDVGSDIRLELRRAVKAQLAKQQHSANKRSKSDLK